MTLGENKMRVDFVSVCYRQLGDLVPIYLVLQDRLISITSVLNKGKEEVFGVLHLTILTQPLRFYGLHFICEPV